MDISADIVCPFLRLRGFADEDAIADLCDAMPDDVKSALQHFAHQKLLKLTPGGAKLLAAGRRRAQSIWRKDAQQIGQADLAELWEHFEPLYDQFQSVVSDWRMRKTQDGPLPNKHDDAAYDAALVHEAAHVHTKFQLLAEGLGAHLARCRHYVRRLTFALQRLQNEDRRYMADPDVSSYHMVVFEMHGELKALLQVSD